MPKNFRGPVYLIHSVVFNFWVDAIYLLTAYHCLFPELHVQFAQFDKDGDGRITREEVVGVMKTLGYTVNADEVNSMLSVADTDSK